MVRNAAFGRPQAQDRLREWWYAKSARVRVNTLLIGVVGAAVVALLMAATSKDATRRTPLANATRPHLTPNTVVVTTSTSTTLAGDLVAAGVAAKPADLFGLSSTTTSSIAVAATVPPARVAAPATTTAPTRSPATTRANPDVIFSEVPTTTTSTMAAAVTTELPTTITTTTTPTPTTATTAPPATTTPTTTSTAITLPLGLPTLLGP